MRTFLELLLAAQPRLLHSSTPISERHTLLERLRSRVPEPILAHFLRLISQGRKGVGLVQNGVCSACHLRLPFGSASLVAKSSDLHLCENCGCYLFVPSAEISVSPPAATLATPRRGRKPRTAAVAA